jgi:hypothetical protein
MAESFPEGSQRTGKQCRERWHNHLDPTLSHAPFTLEEDQKLIRLQSKFDNKWTEISKRMPGRSDNAVKNRWNSSLCKLAVNVSIGRKRSAAVIFDENETHAHQHAGETEFPCAVRSLRGIPFAARVETASLKCAYGIDLTNCFAQNCCNVARYGFRSSSGLVRRTRCFAHHEPGM